MKLCFIAVIFGISGVQWTHAKSEKNTTECVDGPSWWYRGTRSYTKSGIKCQRWDKNRPHRPLQHPKDGGKHNYCRNPDNDIVGTWCYTTNSAIKWEYCDIPKCPDDSLVVWSSVNDRAESTVWSAPANPEIAVQGKKIYQAIYKEQNFSYIWSMASDRIGQRLFVIDFKKNHLAVRHLDTNTTTFHLQGMMQHTEEIAYDWVTKNLYWTDSKMRCILVVEKTIKYYSSVYCTSKPKNIFALTLHAKLRKLFFSLYGNHSEIRSTDLAGKNGKLLLSYPNISDVTSLSLDYTDDRLYIIDYPRDSEGCNLVSSKLDGSNFTVIYQSSFARFRGVSAYLDSVYLTDANKYAHPDIGDYYRIWFITKNGEIARSYQLRNKPRAIAVYSSNEEFSLDEISKEGECEDTKKCEHICLPRIGTKRECACSWGYYKSGTNCSATSLKNNSLVVVDEGQKKIFALQLPLFNSSKNFSVVPIEHHSSNSKISKFVIDELRGILYWSDAVNPAIYKSDLNGSNTIKIIDGKHAVSMAVEPLTGNIYFADRDTDYIYVASVLKHRVYMKTLMKPSKDRANTTTIQMLTLDTINKYVYWVESTGLYYYGNIRRMTFDGRDEKILFTKLFSPMAITVSNQRKSLLFLAEIDVIYEVLLSSFDRINEDGFTLHKKAYVINLPTLSLIADIKVDEPFLYFTDMSRSYVQKFNLTKGTSSLQVASLTSFVRPTALAVFRIPSAFEKDDSNPCNSKNCHQICIVTSQSNATCTCEDGSDSKGLKCYRNGQLIDEPPTYDLCPQDRLIKLLPCEKALVTPNWKVPIWKDDHTAVKDLKLTYANTTGWYKTGSYKFVYTATDSAGNVGHCSFTAFVSRISCKSEIVSNSSIFAISNNTCRQNGLVHDISCRDTSLSIRRGDFFSKTIENICEPEGIWQIPDFSTLSCGIEAANVVATGYRYSAGAIAAIVICSLLGVAIIAIILVKVSKIKKRETSRLPTSTFVSRGDSSYQIFT